MSDRDILGAAAVTGGPGVQSGDETVDHEWHLIATDISTDGELASVAAAAVEGTMQAEREERTGAKGRRQRVTSGVGRPGYLVLSASQGELLGWYEKDAATLEAILGHPPGTLVGSSADIEADVRWLESLAVAERVWAERHWGGPLPRHS